MTEYYTRKEIRNLFYPPVSNHYIRCLQQKKRIPEPIRRTEKGWLYDKKQIDECLSIGIEKEKFGRKAGERHTRMSDEDFDTWNLRKNKENIKYSDEMTLVIMFLQPNLKNRNVGNALGA